MPNGDGRENIGVILDKIVVYVFTSMLGLLTMLIGWLCLQTISLKQDTTAIIEHGRSVDEKLAQHERLMEVLNTNNTKTADQLEHLSIHIAAHDHGGANTRLEFNK